MKKLSKKSPIYVICDSREALSLAFKDGLSEKYKVLTSSPSMILNEKYSNLESLWKEKKIRNFLSSIENNRRKIFNKLYKNKNISHEEAFIVAIQITEYYKTIYKAACLSKKILNSDILYIKAEGYGGRKNIDLNPPWEEILNFKRNFTFKSFIIKKKENKKPNIFEKIKSMHYKLQLLGLDGFLFRLIKKNKILNIFKRDIVFLLGENELLEETTTSMFFKGFKIQTFDDRCNFSDQNKENLSVIRKIINNDIFSITSDWVNKEIISSCEKIFFNNLFSSLGRYYQSKKSAENFLLKYKNKKKILFNARYINPKVLGILSVFKSFKIPVVSFQHGVTPEISDFKTDHGLYSPGNCSDLFLYFNKAITRIADSEDYIKSKAAVVGLPYKYYRASKIKSCFTPSKSKILYLSMNLYKGYFGACFQNAQKVL